MNEVLPMESSSATAWLQHDGRSVSKTDAVSLQSHCCSRGQDHGRFIAAERARGIGPSLIGTPIGTELTASEQDQCSLSAAGSVLPVQAKADRSHCGNSWVGSRRATPMRLLSSRIARPRSKLSRLFSAGKLIRPIPSVAVIPSILRDKQR